VATFWPVRITWLPVFPLKVDLNLAGADIAKTAVLVAFGDPPNAALLN
jgi:hypothetical protein